MAVITHALTSHFFFSKLGPSELRSIVEAMEGAEYGPGVRLAEADGE